MNLDSNLLHTLSYSTFESEQDKYFREKLNRLSKLNMSNYIDLMKKYAMKAASFDGIDMNEFDRDIDELLTKEEKNMIEIPILRNVYKKSVTTNEFIKVGAVTRFGLMDFDTPSDKVVTNPDYYYPEFYTDVEIKETVPETDFTYTLSIEKKSFIPKNLPQQVVTQVDSIFLKPEEYYVTGYVTKEGGVYYYDQYLN